MNFYIVMQGDSYIEEKEYNIISTKVLDKSGNTPHSWKRMEEVQEGDVIFHVVQGEVVAVSAAKSNFSVAPKPYEQANDKAYIVPTCYEPLETAVSIKANWSSLAPLMPYKYAAFQPNGDGNQGYLYPCNEPLALKILELISDANVYNERYEQLQFAIEDIESTTRDTLTPLLVDSESKAKAKMRKYEAKFADKLAPLWSNTCAVCDIQLEPMLCSTYAKPWKDSTDDERIDPFNGLLLCCNHSALYKEGYIAFDGTGKIHIAPELSPNDYGQYGIHIKVRITRQPEHKPYIKWHKKHIFKK